ncbi:MAG TPA: NUDIX domain-containing protein [Candidatus Saccharimonadales bacterium]|nr:NUDIX domain-containing protein [Candidatus Saccharimonadales bacterium]
MMAEEQIDVYDWDGVWTGVTKPKSQVHRDGDIHICVHGVITDGEGRIIAQHRGPGVKLMRNVWDAMSIAGHISALTPEERRDDPFKHDIIWQALRALNREAAEELGQEFPPLVFGDSLTMFGITRTDQRTEDGWMDRTLSVNFMLTMPDANPAAFMLEEDKVLAVCWMHVDEIEAAIETGTGPTLARREPDNYHLLRGVVDCARRIQRLRNQKVG